MILNIDTVKYKAKPTNVGEVVISLKQKSRVVDATIEEIKTAVTSGYSITAGELHGTKAIHWKSQEVFIWDIDNKAKTIKRHTPESVLKLFEDNGIKVNFMYWTFSHSPKCQKFRVVTTCNELIIDPCEAKHIIEGVMSLFETAIEPDEKKEKDITIAQVDLSCTNLDRIYYGTCFGVVEGIGNMNAKFNKADALSLYKEPEQNQLTLHTSQQPRPHVEPGVFDLARAIDEFDLLNYILSTTGSRSGRGRGDETLLNPCPACGHKDDFWVNTKKNTFKCHSASGGAGGNIINYLMEIHGLDKKDAREKFKYELLGIDREEEKQQWREQKRREKLLNVSALKNEKAISMRVETAADGTIIDSNSSSSSSLLYSKDTTKLYTSQYIAKDKKNYLIDINPFKNTIRYQMNDIGFGYLFADTHRKISRYVPQTKSWFTYLNGRWVEDTGGMVVSSQAKKIMYSLNNILLKLSKDETFEGCIDAYQKIIASRKDIKKRKAMIEDARSVYPINITDFDKDFFVLNCENGTLNLKDFTFSEHNPDDLLSQMATVTYDPNAKCDRWEKFIDEIMMGDKEKAKFLQKAFAYSMTGATKEECFFILYGGGEQATRNGKGTAMETLKSILGDYFAAVQPETFAVKQSPNGSAPTEDIARLRGRRLCNASEPEKGLKLNSALIKSLTGGDSVTCRFLHQNSFEYLPQFKVFINTNHKPVINDDSVFKSGRVKLIPFLRHFKEEERDMNLKENLRQPESKSGILNWLLEGLKLYYAEGLSMPQSMIDAIAEYRSESDKIGQFIGESLIRVEGKFIQLKNVYDVYSKYCQDYGYSPLNVSNFMIEMKTKGIFKRDRVLGNGIINYGILDSSTDTPQSKTDHNDLYQDELPKSFL